jgi:C1A family cysteine protease
MGWRHDTPDHRDLEFRPRLKRDAVVPNKMDFRSDPKYARCVPTVRDQGDLSACTGFGVTAVVMFERERQQEALALSPLFTYYQERVLEGTVASDAGAEIRDGIKTLIKYGAAPEAKWPYVPTKFTARPSKAAYAAALDCQALVYARVDNTKLADLIGVLAGGDPFVFGVTLMESFEGDKAEKTGVVPMPARGEQILGGHCMWCCGYVKEAPLFQDGYFIVQNSWGTGCGDRGYYYIPFAYLTDPRLADDFWVVSKVE